MIVCKSSLDIFNIFNFLIDLFDIFDLFKKKNVINTIKIGTNQSLLSDITNKCPTYH